MPYVPRNKNNKFYANDIYYLPTIISNWIGNPDTVHLALDQLADRIYEIEENGSPSIVDSTSIVYNPSLETLSCWQGSSDPGSVFDALEQLVLRVCDIESNSILYYIFDSQIDPPSNPSLGQFYYNTIDSLPYYYNGSSWISMSSSVATNVPFGGITTGTNTSATMTVGTGSSFTFTGSGTINANRFKGNSIIALSDGGTNSNITAVQGGVVYSTSSVLAVSVAGSSGQLLQSGGTGSPSWISVSSLSIDHGNLSGLADDDHSQYLVLVPGSNARNTIAPTATDVASMIIKATSSFSSSHSTFIITTSGGVGLLSLVRNASSDYRFQLNTNAGTSASAFGYIKMDSYTSRSTGYINVSSSSTANGGNVNLVGGSSSGANSGSINLSGSASSGGSLISSGGAQSGSSGGSLNMSGGYHRGGNVYTFSGSEDADVGGEAGDIQTNGGDGGVSGTNVAGGNGGSILTYGGTGGEEDDAFAGDGGKVWTYGANGVGLGVAGGSGGNIYTYAYEDKNGGSLLLNAGSTGNGGSINTSDGGGSIDLTGSGSIQFGVSANRITIQGVSGASGKTLTLPNLTGTIIGATSTSTTDTHIAMATSTAGGIKFVAVSGDATISNTGSLTVANDSITFAKMQNISSGVLLGRSTASSGDVEEITVGSGLSLSGGTLVSTGSGGSVTSVSVVTANGVSGSVANATTTPAITLTLGDITPNSVSASGTVAGSNLSGTNTGDQTITLTGDVTGSGTSSFAATISSNAVTFAKIQQVSSGVILGRSTAGTGDVEALSSSSTKTLLSLDNVENTALSTWNGSSNITTVGTIGTGTWNGSVISNSKIDSALSGKTYDGLTLASQTVGFTIAGGTSSKTLTVSNTLALEGTDSSTLNIGSGGTLGSAAFVSTSTFEVPLTFSTGLTRTTNTITVNTTQNIAKLSNLTSNGFVKTSGSDGTLSVDTNTYLTGNQTITLSGDISGSGTTSITTALGIGVVSYANIQDIAANSILGNNTGFSDTVLALSISDVRSLLSLDNVENTALSTWNGSSNITTVGTIGTGTWNGSVVGPAYGGTGVSNNAASTLTISGNFATTITISGVTSVTLPTSGTLSTLAGSESLTNKKLGSLTSNGFVKTSGGDGTLSVDTNTYLTSAYTTIQDEGSGVTARSIINFVGSAVTAADDAVNSRTNITFDAGLNALATFNTNGFLVQTSDNNFAGRTISAGSSKITITNGDGVSGNPSIDVSESNLTHNNIGGLTTGDPHTQYLVIDPTSSSRNVIAPNGSGIQGLSITESSSAAAPYRLFSVGNTTKAIDVTVVSSNTYTVTIPSLSSTTVTSTSLVIGDGTVSTPSIRFNSDTDTGFYRSTSNSIDFSAGGNRHLQLLYNGSSKKQTLVYGDKATILASGQYGFGYRTSGWDLSNSAFSVYDGTDTLHVQGNEILTSAGDLRFKVYNNNSVGGNIYFHVNSGGTFDPVAFVNTTGLGIGTTAPLNSIQARFATHGGIVLHTRQLSGSAGSANIYFKYDTGEPNFKGNFAISYVPNGTTGTDEYYGKLHISVRTTATDAAPAGDANAATNSVFCVDSQSGANSVNIGVGGVTSPTARLHLIGGTSSSGTAPLKFTSGTNLGTIEAGALEYDGTVLTLCSSVTRSAISFVDIEEYFSSVNLNDYPIGDLIGTLIIENDAKIDLTGIVAPTYNGRQLFIVNNKNSVNTITIKHDSASSTSSNRFDTYSGLDVDLNPGDYVLAIYYGSISRWMISNRV